MQMETSLSFYLIMFDLNFKQVILLIQEIQFKVGGFIYPVLFSECTTAQYCGESEGETSATPFEILIVWRKGTRGVFLSPVQVF